MGSTTKTPGRPLAKSWRLNFTKTTLKKLAEGDKRFWVYDEIIPHLALAVSPAGTKTFYLYRKIGGRPERICLGRFPAVSVENARRAAERINGEVAGRENPAEARRVARKRITLADLFTKYLDDHIKPRGKQTKNPRSYYKRYLSHWADRHLDEISAADVQRLHTRIGGEKGPVTANRAYQLLRAMYGRAAYWGLFDGANPASKVDRFRERSRDRFLQPDEMPRFFRALADEGNALFRDFVLLCLLTGARRGNVQAMAWADLNLEAATWRIPRTKTGDPLTVVLVPEAVRILEQRQASAVSEWVFPGRGSVGHYAEPRRAWAKLLARAEIADLHIHDLRRTLGSWQAAAGASLTVIGKSLGHTNVSTTAIYARLNLDPVRASVSAATAAMLTAGGIAERADVERVK